MPTLDLNRAYQTGGLGYGLSNPFSGYSFGPGPTANISGGLASGGLGIVSRPAAPTRGSVLGAQAPQNPVVNTFQQPQNNPQPQQPDNSAELGKLNTQFDYLQNQGNQQLSSLSNVYNQNVNDLNTSLEGVRTQVGQEKNQAASAKDKNIEQAGATAKNTQNQNRQTLRALGILNSSTAGDLLTKPMTEFGKVKAQFVQAYNDRVGELDNFLNQKTAEHSNLLSQLANQYQSLVGNIQNDLRFSDRQRVDAINAANAALSDRIAQVKQAQQTIKDRVSAQKLQLLQEAGQMSAYTDPNFNYMDFTQNTLIPTLTGQSPTTVGLAQDERKRQPGLTDINAAFQTGGLVPQY